NGWAKLANRSRFRVWCQLLSRSSHQLGNQWNDARGCLHRRRTARHIDYKCAISSVSVSAASPIRPGRSPPINRDSILAFGLDMDVLLTTEATGGATSVIVAWHKPGGPPDHVHFKTGRAKAYLAESSR